MNKKMEALIEDINPKEIASHIETDTLSEWCEILRHELIRTLNKMERIAEPKTGNWVRITKGLTFEKYACSICGRQIEDAGSGELLLVKYPYCHCGAKMERSKE